MTVHELAELLLQVPNQNLDANKVTFEQDLFCKKCLYGMRGFNQTWYCGNNCKQNDIKCLMERRGFNDE